MTPEIESFQEFFQKMLGQATQMVADLPAEALNWRPLGGAETHETNSLAATATHIAGNVRWMVGEIVGGRPANRDRDAEFRAVAADGEALQRQLAASAALAAEVLASLPPHALDEVVAVRDQPHTRRWVLLHSLTHAHLHLGHMQLTLQLWLAQTQAPPQD